MKPVYADGFRRFFRLGDLLGHDDPHFVLEALASLASWHSAKNRDEHADCDEQAYCDELLLKFQDDTTFSMSLPLYFAPIDRQFFLLAKRSMARTLLSRETFELGYRQMAAVLLLNDPPTNPRPKSVRDALIVMGLIVGQEIGWNPTENAVRSVTPRSEKSDGFRNLIDSISPRDTPSVQTVNQIWGQKIEKLTAAGFEKSQALYFCRRGFPMKQ